MRLEHCPLLGSLLGVSSGKALHFPLGHTEDAYS